MTPNDLSFLPEDYHHRRGRRRTAVAGATVLLVVLAGIGSAVFISQRSLHQVEKDDAEITQAYGDASQRIAALRQQRQDQGDAVRRAALATALTDGIPRSNILAELTDALPDGASLLEMTLESHPRLEPVPAGSTAFDMKKAQIEARRGAETIGVDIPAEEEVIRISGLAQTDVQVAQYLNQLSRSPLFQDVSLLVSETQTAPGAPAAILRRFQIQMTVNLSARLKPASSAIQTTAAISVP